MTEANGYFHLIIMKINNLDSLTKLAIKYKTDKCPQIKHPYTPVYFELLKDKRESVKKVLEIGIGKGASLLMWRDFFPNAQIYGVDIIPEALVSGKRIKSYLCDQTKESDLQELIKNIGSDLDLIIDDGSHIRADQLFACKTLMPLVKKDVLYIIEDVRDPQIAASYLSEYNCEIPPMRRRYRDDNIILVRNNLMATDTQANISIFAKPAFLNVRPNKPFKYGGKPPLRGRLMRMSSITRGEQIASRIGAKLNPANGYQNDICIYVKPPYEPRGDFMFEGKKAYLDICDSPELTDLAKKHPEVTVISDSKMSFETLKTILPNKIVNIPEHHCNFERQRRRRKEITTVGCIRNSGSFKYMPKDIRKRLSERGMELVEFAKIFTRDDVVNFYKNVDIQIIWRPYMDASKNKLRNPMRIINASSFGIPTIMYEEKSAEEMKGCYIPVHTLDEFLVEVDKLRSNPKLYEKYAKRCIEKSEKYHIDNIAKLYKSLASE